MSETVRQKVLIERRGPILIVTLNRPEVKNACDDETSQKLNEAMDLLESDQSLFIGILTGVGDNFSAGADLKAVARGELSKFPPRGGFGLVERPPRKPLIAAVEGVAVGGGLELCLACDLVIAARDARMGLPEVRHNIVALGGGLLRLPKRIPYHIAMEVALSGTLRGPEFFERWGLINWIVEPGQALTTAISKAEELLANGPTALAATKEIVFQTGNWSEEQGWRDQMKVAEVALNSEDRKEGLRAFAEKRRPEWKGY